MRKTFAGVVLALVLALATPAMATTYPPNAHFYTWAVDSTYHYGVGGMINVTSNITPTHSGKVQALFAAVQDRYTYVEVGHHYWASDGFQPVAFWSYAIDGAYHGPYDVGAVSRGLNEHYQAYWAPSSGTGLGSYYAVYQNSARVGTARIATFTSAYPETNAETQYYSTDNNYEKAYSLYWTDSSAAWHAWVSPREDNCQNYGINYKDPNYHITVDSATQVESIHN
jgi:hypothetical protein